MTVVHDVPVGPFTFAGERVFTPFPADGPRDVDVRDDRLRLHLTADDANRFYAVRDTDMWTIVTDQRTGARWAIRDWDCGFDCNCAAVARRTAVEMVNVARLTRGDIITEVDTPDGPFYEVTKVQGRDLTVRSHGEEVTLPGQPGAVVLRLTP